MVLRGDLDSAAVLYRALHAERGADWRPALAGLIALASRRGDARSAAAWADELLADWAGGDGWSAADRLAAGRALALTAAGRPDRVREALAAFDAATAADSAGTAGRLASAQLFLSHYNAPEARADFDRVLDRDPENVAALVGLASVAAFEGSADAMPRVRAALAVNPHSVTAHLLLAQLLLESENYDSAAVAIDAALAVDSSRVDAWAAAGALAWVRDDTVGFNRATDRAVQINPRGGDYFAAVAEAAARHRRYADAVSLAARGVARDSTSVAALVAWGTNLLRTQQISDGRAALERAFRGDPFHLWTKNSLDLLDLLATFRTVRSARFEIVAPPASAELLGQLLLPLLEEAYDSLAVRYDYRPPTPIRLELYDRHADFSVRTVGLSGFGALGVSFGTTLVMDAPAARRPAEFNLGSTAWHELAHTFTLGRSAHRVPRWLSEGLSVLEERRARPGWGASINPGFVQAFASGALLPIARLNEGFLRPDRPDRLQLSYYQASLVAEYFEQQMGIAGLRAVLSGYAAGEATEPLLVRVSGRGKAELESGFTDWLRVRLRQPLAAMAAGDSGVIAAPMRAAAGALAVGDSSAARRALEQVRDRFPEWGTSDGPRLLLAQLYRAAGRSADALRELAVVTSTDETGLVANRLEANWRLAAGDTTAALAALVRASWMAPNDVDIWDRLGGLAVAAGQTVEAVRARRARLALDPPDPLAARTDLAQALLADQQLDAARRELLAVLEQAPGYERAQALLLTVHARRSGP
jgi:tetratricopeptide (TPR) repeat protein